MPDVVVQIVQHLRPGGLEVVALDLLGRAPAGVAVSLHHPSGDPRPFVLDRHELGRVAAAHYRLLVA